MRAATADAPPPTFTPAPTGWSMSAFHAVSIADVTTAIHQLPDKQCASDPLPTRLLKDTVDLLAPFITTLFNKSLASGMFPAVFKSAYITPRLKKVSSHPADVKSYRPISNFPVLSKTLERLLTSSSSISTCGVCCQMPSRRTVQTTPRKPRCCVCCQTFSTHLTAVTSPC